MAHRELNLSLHKQVLYGQIWQPETPKAVLVIHHGHGEHSGRYAPMAAVMNEAGIAVIALDQFGHGKTTGSQGVPPSYDAMLDVVDLGIKEAKDQFPGLPIFLHGHSMGGNIVAAYVLRRGAPANGVILSSAFLVLEVKPTMTQNIMARVGKLLMPSLAQPTKLDASHITRIPEEVEKYKNDPLIHDMMSAKLYFGILDNADYVMEHASEWSLPVLIMHGTGDKIVSTIGSEHLAKHITGVVTYRPFEGGYHEVHYDIEGAEMMTEIKDWILAHVTH